MPKFEDRETFSDRANAATTDMRKVFEITPLQRNDYLSSRYNSNIYLKREDLTPVRSYKLRGAFNSMRKMRSVSHFVCASAGNHAQGVAFMASHFDVTATIYMPITTPQQKVSKTKIFGGKNIEIKLIGDYFDECLAAAEAFSVAENAYFISPFDNADVIEGQGTVAVEIEQQLGFVPDRIIMPVGGGGLASGITSFFGTNCQYSFVEPAGAASLKAALIAGQPKKLLRIDNFTDGASAVSYTHLTLPTIE